MTSRDFCYWLQGFFEISGHDKPGLTANQRQIIQDHLSMVFKHEIDHSYGDSNHQKELDGLHKSKEGTPRC